MLPKQLWDYYESIQLHQCRDAWYFRFSSVVSTQCNLVYQSLMECGLRITFGLSKKSIVFWRHENKLTPFMSWCYAHKGVGSASMISFKNWMPVYITNPIGINNGNAKNSKLCCTSFEMGNAVKLLSDYGCKDIAAKSHDAQTLPFLLIGCIHHVSVISRLKELKELLSDSPRMTTFKTNDKQVR